MIVLLNPSMDTPAPHTRPISKPTICTISPTLPHPITPIHKLFYISPTPVLQSFKTTASPMGPLSDKCVNGLGISRKNSKPFN